jgi:uncharacterized protein (DUF2141 family)
MAALAYAAPAPLFATLRVTVDGVTSAGGTLRIFLHDEATFPEPNASPLKRNDIPKIAGDVSAVFDRLPPGDYALRAFQDVNDNGKWDAGEPQANSNGAAAGDFDKAAIGLMPGSTMAALHLR